MNLLLDTSVRMSAVLLGALAIAALLGRQSAALRHWVLATALACATAIPLLQLVAPSWGVRLAPPLQAPAIGRVDALISIDAPAGRPEPARERKPIRSPGSAGDLMGGLWAAGAAVNLGLLMLGAARLRWLASRARVVVRGRWPALAAEISRSSGVRRPVTVLRTDQPALLVTWGMFRPKVMIPSASETWSDERIRVVLSHELAHVRRADWAWQMTAAVARAVCWFNPIVWLTVRRMRQESERACDDEVLRTGVGGREYAAHLVELATSFRADRRTWRGLPAPAIAFPTNLERRIAAMLNARLNRRPLTRTAQIFVVLGLFAVTVSVAGLGAQAFATLSGTVTDPNGGFLVNATLTLTHVQSQAKHEVRSDATGHFQFVGLPAGDYRLRTHAVGFAGLDDRLTLASGQTAQRNLVFQVGSLEETITVTDTPSSATERRVGGYARTAPACTPSTGGGQLTPPTKVTDVRPSFPSGLRASSTRITLDSRAGPDGHAVNAVRAVRSTRVVLDARIGTDGTVKEVRAVQPVDADAEDAAIAAVKQWEFTPTLLNCVPIEVSMKVNVSFNQ